MEENKIEERPVDGAQGDSPRPEGPPADQTSPETPETGAESTEGKPEGGEQRQEFTPEYVGKLREESATTRTRLRDREQAMHRLLVEQTGRLADPADLAFDATHLDDPEALGAAIDALLEAKPHLRARQFGGVEQGPTGKPTAEVDLLGTLRGML